MTVGDNLISKDIFRLKRKNNKFDEAFRIAKEGMMRVSGLLDEMHAYTHTPTQEPLTSLDPEHTKELVVALETARHLVAVLNKAFVEVIE